MAELRKLLLKIDGDVSNAVTALEAINKKLGEQSQKIKKVADDSKASGEDLVRSFSKWSSAFFRFIGLAEMAGGKVKEVFDAASEGARIMAAQSFFEGAGRSIEDLRAATSGMISDAELMKKANLADSMGISMDTFKTLAQVAQASALKTGQSFDYMFESIIVGTARSSRLLLDNLGIIVSVKEANENYARAQLELQGVQNATNAQINAYVEAMDDAAKKTAFAEEVQRKSKGTIDEMGGAATSTAQTYDRLNTAVANLSDTLKKTLAESAREAASSLDIILRKFDLLVQRQGILSASGTALWEIYKNIFLLPGGETGRGLGDIAAGMSRAAAPSEQEAARAKRFVEQQLAEGLQELAKKMGTADVGKAVLELSKYMASGEATDSKLTETLDRLVELNRLLGNAISAAKIPNGSGGKIGEKIGKKTAQKQEEPFSFDFSGLRKEIQDERDAFDKWLKSLEPSFEDLIRESKRLAEAQRLASMSLDQIALELVQPISDAVGQAVGTIARGGGLFAPLTDMANDLMKEQGGIGGVISTGLTGAGMGAGVAGPLGAAIGAIIPVIVSLIDELAPVASFIASIVEGLKLFVRNGLGEFMRMLEPLGPALSLLLAAFGNLMAANLRPVALLLTAVTSALSFVVTLLAGFIGVMAPISEIIGQIIYAFISGFTTILPLFFDLNGALNNVIGAAKDFTKGMILAIININNGIVKAIRSLGLKGFGKILKYDDFVLATDNNTEAVKDNTKAVKDLAREFRNMPAGYKVNRTIYEASNPVGPTMLRISSAELSRLGAANATRWRM